LPPSLSCASASGTLASASPDPEPSWDPLVGTQIDDVPSLSQRMPTPHASGPRLAHASGLSGLPHAIASEKIVNEIQALFDMATGLTT
jgi:hypothetical protein